MSSIESRITGTRDSHILQEFFTNSGHFPLALIFFEMLVDGPLEYIVKPDAYITLLAGLAQAVFLGTARFRGKPRPVLGNLIGPAIYSIIEVVMEGFEFFEKPHHIAYWLISFAIGLLRYVQLRSPRTIREAAILLENMVRASIMLVMYWVIEGLSHPESKTVADFLSDNSHIFVTVLIPVLGLFVGLANISAERALALLRKTADRLRQYSEWFLGRDLLSSAVDDPDVLTLSRRRRAVVFMDIRGFTRWSETRLPEEVVGMLNRYFEQSERIWSMGKPIKVKLSADEVMLIFDDVESAVRTARMLMDSSVTSLRGYGLSVGIGVHAGQLVEGVMGSQSVRGYDVIGDTVNTAKRLCDAADGGEVLISEITYDSLEAPPPCDGARDISVKGKNKPLTVYSLRQGSAADRDTAAQLASAS